MRTMKDRLLHKQIFRSWLKSYLLLLLIPLLLMLGSYVTVEADVLKADLSLKFAQLLLEVCMQTLTGTTKGNAFFEETIIFHAGISFS